jgi:hypothetical protein
MQRRNLRLAATTAATILWASNVGCLSRLLDPSKAQMRFQTRFPEGMPLQEARSALKSKRIDFEEKFYASPGVVQLLPGNDPVSVGPGEVVISTRSDIAMGCWDMNPILIFGKDETLRKVYFSGLPNCP